MMAMAQLLNIRMPVSYEVTFPPQNTDVGGVDGTVKGPGQSGMHLEIRFALSRVFCFLFQMFTKVCEISRIIV